MIIETRISVGMLRCNSYICRDEATGQLALIDCGVFSGRIAEAIARAGGDLRYILLTHGHFDHTYGVPKAKATYPGAVIAISEADAPYLRGEITSVSGRPGGNSRHAIEPDLLLHDGDVLPLGETSIEVIVTPGHTPGGVTYMSAADKLLFTGDTLFLEEVGRDDLPGGDWAQELASLQRLLALPADYAVHPGHGESTSIGHEREANPYVGKGVRASDF